MKIERYTLTDKDAGRLYRYNYYFVTYSNVYSISYCAASQIYCYNRVYSKKGIGKRGTYEYLTASEINDRIGTPIFNER